MTAESDDTGGVRPAAAKAETASGIRRRELLVGGGAIAGAALITRLESNHKLFEELLRGSSQQASFTASMLRPEDMLAFDLEFYLARYEVDNKADIVYAFPATGRREFYMVAVFGPQAVAEEPVPNAQAPDLPVPAQLGGPSRLAFAVRGQMLLDDDSILDWVTLKKQPQAPRARGSADAQRKRMLLVPPALNFKERNKLGVRPKPQQPKRTETAIEAPYRMVLSPANEDPNGEQFWRNRTSPLVNENRTELWHTRLVNVSCLDDLCSAGQRQKNGVERPESQIRAVWTQGWDNNLPAKPFARDMTLRPPLRKEIVSLSSDFSSGKFSPESGWARLLTLSALGSSFDLHFDFPETKGFDVTHWSDRGTLGREHYVKVVLRGYLFPFGHEVVLTDISERQIDADNGDGLAVLRKRQYLTVKEKTRTYSSFEFPFKSVTIVDTITPLLDNPSFIPNNTGGGSFWPLIGGRDYLWTLAATDAEGIRVEFQAPLIFVNAAVAESAGTKKTLNLAGVYNGDARRERPLGGQSVAYAQPIPGKARQAAFPTDVLEFGAKVGSNGRANFVPYMRSAAISNPALGTLGSSSARSVDRGALDPGALLRVAPAEAYVKHGFNADNNPAQAFLKLTEKKALDYTKDAGAAATGALGAPNMDLAGLSRTLGPIGADLANGKVPEFKPADIFKGAKFLGIDFLDVLQNAIPFPKPADLAGNPEKYARDAAKLPRTLTETIYEGQEAGEQIRDLARRIPKEIRTEFVWEPELKGNGVFIATLPSGEKATMLLRNVTVVPFTPGGEQPVGTARQDTTGELRNFGLSLFGKPGDASAFLILYFNRFEFRSRNDQKPDVNVDIRDVVFAGALSFVNDLRKLMSSLSGGSGLSIDITPEGVVAGYGLDFPTITTGVLTLADLSLGAQVEVPFDGKPVTTRFNFCKPDRPFLLTYTIFGGGGYANIAINSAGVESLTVSLEFGAATAINLGVASGSVQVMAGILIKVETIEEKTNATLGGFVRLRGELEVLGIISVSLTFNLSLTYNTGSGEATGRATLTVEVEVFCFSKSVSVSCEKKFKGGGGGLRARGQGDGAAGALGGAGAPSPIPFDELFSPEAWDTYRAAFAQEAF